MTLRDHPSDHAHRTGDEPSAEPAAGKRSATERIQRKAGAPTAVAAPATAAPGPVQRLEDPYGFHLLESNAAGSPVQRTGGADGPDAAVHAAAARGITDSAAALPHLDTIQRSFGHHDVSGVVAHTGTTAREAAGAMGAEAYATGNHVVFAGAPSLHTAAHEAAHVVQQQGGVQLKGGVGEVGDAYERHADAVADKVVAGESAVDLLDTMAAPGGAPRGAAASGPVQRKFVGTLAGVAVSAIVAELKSKYPGATIRPFQVTKLQNTFDHEYGTIEEVAAALNLTSGEGTTGKETPKPPEPTREERPKPIPRGPGKQVRTPTPTVEPESVTTGPPEQGDKESGGEDVVPKESVGTPENSETEREPVKDGRLRVLNLPTMNVPAVNTKVFPSPPEFITVQFAGQTYRVLAGQDFLNAEKSAVYRGDSSVIRGAEVVLMKAPVNLNLPEDIRVIADGHHRFFWMSFHGQDVPAKERKIGAFTPQPWSNLTFKPNL
jgi:hypothetical protein